MEVSSLFYIETFFIITNFKKKKLFEEDLAVKNHVAKSQGIYFESGLIEALNG